MSHSHTHDNGHTHAHDDPFNGHGHSHDILDGPGSYLGRELPLTDERDWKDRGFTIGIGGYACHYKGAFWIALADFIGRWDPGRRL